MSAIKKLSKKDAKPCPFCGSMDLELITATNIYNFDKTHPCHVFCLKCGGCTGYRANEKNALDSWNERAIE